MPIDLVMDERDADGKLRSDSVGSDDSGDNRGNAENIQVCFVLIFDTVVSWYLTKFSTTHGQIWRRYKHAW